MGKVLVTLAERKQIAEKFTKELGSNVKYRVMDVDTVARKIQTERKAQNLSTFIEIKPVSEDQFKVPMRLATFQKDPVTGVMYGIPAFVDDYGNIKWQKIQLNDAMSLNMENLNDAKIWAVIRFHPDVKNSPWQTQNPYYEIYDPVIEADAKDLRIEMMKKAFGYVDKLILDSAAMVMFARYLGAELHDQSNFKIVKSELLNYAEGNPKEFIEKYTSGVRKYHELLKTAIANAVVIESPDSGFMFKNIPMGYTEEEAVEFIKKDSAVAMGIADTIAKSDKVIPIVKDTMPKNEPAKTAPAAGAGKAKEKETTETFE